MTNGPVIEAELLTRRYGKLLAVDGVSFRIEPGELFGILGPNGAGKTTTIRMLYGFSPLTSGELRVFGFDIRSHWRAIRARTGICHQENNCDPDLTVLENLVVFARYFRIPRRAAQARALELLKVIGLDSRADSPVNELSGGMLRRLISARALINSPQLLILDEPTTGLDPQSRHQVWERLEKLKQQGISILLTTHYMEEAAQLCDRLIIMDRGRILAEGSPRALIDAHVGRLVMKSSPATDELRFLARSHGLEYEDLEHRIIIYCRDQAGLFDEFLSRSSPTYS